MAIQRSRRARRRSPEIEFNVSNGTSKDFDVERFKHSDLTVMSPINFAQWDRAGWCGVASLVWKDNEQIPDLILTFADPEAPIKIFRGWQKRVGTNDVKDWIGVTIITGIDKDHPAHYRVVIGVNENLVRSLRGGTGLMSSVFRMKDVTPESNVNIQRFIDAYERDGGVIAWCQDYTFQGSRCRGLHRVIFPLKNGFYELYRPGRSETLIFSASNWRYRYPVDTTGR